MKKLADKIQRWVYLMGKYSLSSLTATGFDFLAFHLALSGMAMPAVKATVVGRTVGAVIAFGLQRQWVFQRARAARGWILVGKYLGGVLLGMGLNVSGVWLLHNVIGWLPWPARISAACISWLLIFLFNNFVVFNAPANRRSLDYRT